MTAPKMPASISVWLHDPNNPNSGGWTSGRGPHGAAPYLSPEAVTQAIAEALRKFAKEGNQPCNR